MNEHDVSDKPPWIQQLPRLTIGKIEARRDDVFATLQAVDEAVTRIVRALEGTGRLHDTLIIYTSDNGSSWGEHRMPVGNKFEPYMGVMHVPLVVRWDGEVAAGVRDARVAANVDIPVTLADAAGVSPGDVDGHSLLRRARTDGVPLSAAETFAGSGDGLSFDRPAYCGYLTRRFIYTFYATGHEELYDLVDDPYELDNLAGRVRFRDAQARLRELADVACRPRPPGF